MIEIQLDNPLSPVEKKKIKSKKKKPLKKKIKYWY